MIRCCDKKRHAIGPEASSLLRGGGCGWHGATGEDILVLGLDKRGHVEARHSRELNIVGVNLGQSRKIDDFAGHEDLDIFRLASTRESDNEDFLRHNADRA